MENKEKAILIIEDDKSLSKAIEDKLKREHFNVFTAFDGQEGLKVAMDQKPDLILLDIIMPIMDGLTALNRIRADEWGKNVPIIILTNLSAGEEINEAIQRGVYDFLTKSDWKLSDVIELIKNKLKK